MTRTYKLLEYIRLATHLFLREFLAPPLLADLMALVVSARGTITAIVLSLASDAFATSFPLLLHLLVHASATNVCVHVYRTIHVHLVGFEARRAGNGGHLTRIFRTDLHVTGGPVAVDAALQAGGPHFPPLFLTKVIPRRRRQVAVYFLLDTVVQTTVTVLDLSHRVLELSGM